MSKSKANEAAGCGRTKPVTLAAVGGGGKVTAASANPSTLYTHIDNVANTCPPDTGSQNANNGLYDLIGRMYRVGVRFNN